MLGPHYQLHAAIVDDLVVRLDLGKLLCDVVKALEEKTVGELHDVRLMNRGHFFTAIAAGKLERITANARRSFFRDDLETLDYARNYHMLKAGIKAFCILTNDN